MGRINDVEELPGEKRFFADYFNFRKDHYHGKGESDEWWEEFVNSVNEMEKKYNSQFQRDLLVALVADIERRARE